MYDSVFFQCFLYHLGAHDINNQKGIILPSKARCPDTKSSFFQDHFCFTKTIKYALQLCYVWILKIDVRAICVNGCVDVMDIGASILLQPIKINYYHENKISLFWHMFFEVGWCSNIMYVACVKNFNCYSYP